MSNIVARRCSINPQIILISLGILVAHFRVMPANAAQSFTAQQCRQATAVANGLMTKYNGKISAQFVASLKAFVARDCDTNVDFVRMPGTSDSDAFGEFRLQLITIRQ